MGFSRLDVDINFIAASEAGGGRVAAFWSSQSLKRATCPSRVCLRTSMYVKHPVARGSSMTRAPGPLPVSAATGQPLHPWHPCGSVPRYHGYISGTISTYILVSLTRFENLAK